MFNSKWKKKLINSKTQFTIIRKTQFKQNAKALCAKNQNEFRSICTEINFVVDMLNLYIREKTKQIWRKDKKVFL